MKNLNFILQGKKYYRKAILLLGAILGFSSTIVAQYGAPMTHYKINGFVKSKDCNMPIPKIKIKYSENDYVYTDKAGKFEITCEEYCFYHDNNIYSNNRTIKIIAEDVDGNANTGKFLALEKWFTLKEKKTVKINSNYSFGDYEVVMNDMKIEMEYKGKSPCKTELPIDSLIMPPVNNDTSTASILAKSDSLNITNIKKPPQFLNDELLMVFPNPSKGSFTIKLIVEKACNVSIFVYDSDSKLVLTEIWGNCEGTVQKSVSLNGKAPGMHCPQKVRHLMGAFLCIKEPSTIMNLGFNV